MSNNSADHECTLCYEEFSDEHPAVALPNCRHVYGQECIRTWIESDNAQHDKCPTCRAPIFDAPAPIPAQPAYRPGPIVQAGDRRAPTPQVARQPAYVPAEIRGASRQIRHAPDQVRRVYPNSHRNESFDSYSSSSSASSLSYRFASSGSSYHVVQYYQPHHHHGNEPCHYHGHHCVNQAPTGFRTRIRNLFRRRTPEPRCHHHSGGRGAGGAGVRAESAMHDMDAAMRDVDAMLDAIRFDRRD